MINILCQYSAEIEHANSFKMLKMEFLVLSSQKLDHEVASVK
jgi:hypothetical protein